MAFNLATVRSLLARVFFVGVLSMALLVLSYPGKAATSARVCSMSCCQQDGAKPPHHGERPAPPLAPQGLPCCPACALAFGVAPTAGAALIFSPGPVEAIVSGSPTALRRAQPPPVPPPRSAVA
jgi:hypothetical protein